MKNILIIGPNFFDYTYKIASVFSNKGYNTFVENFDDPVHPFKGITKLKYKFFFNKENQKKISRKKYKYYIEDKFIKISPDLVFILNGNILEIDTLDFFRESSKVVLWMFDNLNRFSYSVSLVNHVDLFLCFDKSDVDLLRGKGIDAFFLPQAYDVSTYYPFFYKDKDIDILFVGNMYGYEKRKILLNKVIDKFSDHCTIRFYGIYQYFSKNPLKWLFRPHKNIFFNNIVSPNYVNDLYNRSKIVLNIHHQEQKYGANPKVYEICGAGAYQICDKNPFITSLFQNGEVGLYDNEEELFELIDYALTHDMSQNAKAGYEIVLNNHTFDKRIEQMLELLK